MTQTILALNPDTGDVVSEVRVSGGMPIFSDDVVYASPLNIMPIPVAARVPGAAVIATAKDKVSSPLKTSLGHIRFDSLDRQLAETSAALGFDYYVLNAESDVVKIKHDSILAFVAEIQVLMVERLQSVTTTMNRFLVQGATPGDITEWLTED